MVEQNYVPNFWVKEAPVVFTTASAWAAVHKKHRLAFLVAAQFVIQLVAIPDVKVAVPVWLDFREEFHTLNSKKVA